MMVKHEPGEGDITIQDGRGDAFSHIWQYGKEITKGWSESENALIRAHCEQTQFWPDVWRISDHGNAVLISTDVYGDVDADPSRVVFVNSSGWRDCDPMASVIGFDYEAVLREVAGQIDDEREYDPDADSDDLLDYGPMTFTLAQVIRDCIYGGEELAELMREGIITV